jgi:hypothetical protein
MAMRSAKSTKPDKAVKSKKAAKRQAKRTRRSAHSSSGMIWNLLSILALLAVVCLVGGFLMIFINPYSGLNPFPPPTLPVAMALPSATPTSINVLPPTWTPVQMIQSTPTIKPTSTLPPSPTFFVLPSETPTSTPTLTPTFTPTKSTRYVPQKNSPFYVNADSMGGNRGCKFLGVAGQVFDANGSPVQGLTIFLGGELNGKTMKLRTLTGSAPLYGPGGYEIKIRKEPIKTKGTLYVQVIDPYGKEVSPEVYFWTYDDCDKNLIIINFVQQ